MTSPADGCPDCRWVMDDMVNQFGKLIEGPAGHYEFCERHGQDASPTYEELQAENARLEDKLHYLTGDNYDLRMRAEELQGKLAASEETVRELREAMRELRYASRFVRSEHSPAEWAAVVRFIELADAASAPDGASAPASWQEAKSALAENDWLRENGFKERERAEEARAELERLRGIIRDIRTAAPQNYQYMIKLCDDALSERSSSSSQRQKRSTSPAEEQS